VQIIPVIDILNGLAVSGKKGERAAYKPVHSILTSSSNPVELAKAFKDIFGLHALYIADLNGLTGTGDNVNMVKQIQKTTGTRIMLDPGISDIASMTENVLGASDAIIIGTESLASLSVVEHAIHRKGIENVIISIDMKAGMMLSNTKELNGPEHTVNLLNNQFGIQNFILLDLQNIGSMHGPATTLKPLIQSVCKLGAYCIIGGGINTVNDLISMEQAGAGAVLIATALHSGKIAKQDLEDYMFCT
jgi:phosphoribosylformimino-5-aminoimidazole carboxamide ribotide isomerase